MNTIWSALKKILQFGKDNVGEAVNVLSLLETLLHILHLIHEKRTPQEIEALAAEATTAISDLAGLGIPPEHINALRDAIVAITEDLQPTQ